MYCAYRRAEVILHINHDQCSGGSHAGSTCRLSGSWLGFWFKAIHLIGSRWLCDMHNGASGLHYPDDMK